MSHIKQYLKIIPILLLFLYQRIIYGITPSVLLVMSIFPQGNTHYKSDKHSLKFSHDFRITLIIHLLLLGYFNMSTADLQDKLTDTVTLVTGLFFPINGSPYFMD